MTEPALEPLPPDAWLPATPLGFGAARILLDFECVAVRVPDTAAWIEACSGANYTHGDAAHLRRGAAQIEERLIRWPEMPADWEFEYGPRDAKGVASSGLRWRYIGIVGASIQYEGADEVSAARADALMETLCWANP